jgi:hypothetical protein
MNQLHFRMAIRHLRWLIVFGAVIGWFRPANPFGQYPGPLLVASAQSLSVGPLRVSEDRRYLVDSQGAPFFWLGDTPWSLFATYSRADVITYLDDRKAKGYTVIQAVACWRDGNGCMANLDGERPFVGGDPSQPNEAYFQNVDWILAQADQRGIVVALVPIWSNGLIAPWNTILNEQQAREYGRYLGARYAQQNNIVWVLGGDTYVWDKGPIHQAMATGIKQTDSGNKLTTFHPSSDIPNSLGGVTTDPRFNPFGASEGFLDFNMAQSWAYRSDLPRLLALMYENHPVKPGVVAEGSYEGSVTDYPTGPVTPELVRREAWLSYLSGGGYTYGHMAIWAHTTDWQRALDDPGAKSMAVLRNFMRTRRWWRYAPDTTIFPAGVLPAAVSNTLSGGVAARSIDGDGILVYFSGPSAGVLNIGGLTSAQNYSALWINPENGDQIAAGDLSNAGVHTYQTPAGWNDSVLALDNWSQFQPLSGLAAGSFVTGVNLNGPSVMVESQPWLSYQDALARGLIIDAGVPGTATGSLRYRPAASADTSAMLATAIWNPNGGTSGGVRLRQELPDGTYDVYLWMAEDYRSFYRSLQVRLQGQVAAEGVGHLQMGAWARYGPYRTVVTGGSLRLELLGGTGDPALSGFAIYRPYIDVRKGSR